MERAVILIGVSHPAGQMPLQAVESGVHAMQKWAKSQGIPESSIKTLTDAGSTVSVQAVKAAVRELVERATIEQLIIYFAGHGINLHLNEYWLLSNATLDPDEAIDVSTSLIFARRSLIPHVIFVSDACRTAPEGIQAQSVTGSVVFPSSGGGGTSKDVDTFFACVLGAASQEIKNPAVSAGGYRAIYTDTLVDALEGRAATVCERGTDGADYVRPRPLGDFLEVEVPRRIATILGALAPNQTPDAIIPSEPSAWVSRLPDRGAPVQPPPAPPLADEVDGGVSPDGRGGETVSPPVTTSLWGLSGEALGRAFGLGSRPKPVSRGDSPVTRNFELALGSASEEFGPDHFETECGFKLLGRRLIGTQSEVALDILDDGRLAKPRTMLAAAQVVLLILEDGSGVPLPVVPGFIAALNFEGPDLVNVSYEPSSNTWRWAEYAERAAELRTLRGIVATATRHGAFRLDGGSAAALARRMQYAKGVDPAMALYAAYGYHAINATPRIREMDLYLSRDLQFRFFDLAMLGSDGGERAELAGLPVLPSHPLLAQGWGLLGAFDVPVPAGMRGLRRHLTSSLWSHFTPEGVAQYGAMLSQLEGAPR